jgi:hypothetical protein
MKTLTFCLMALFILLMSASPPAMAEDGAAQPSTEQQIATIKAQQKQVIEQVKAIVNQPITHVPRSPWAMMSIFHPGWFHPGAILPDFNKVDIRQTQDTAPYARNHYVSSDLNPSEMFLGAELEFNSMTKYFYTDRSLPKKKLTEKEMLEINSLYRIIGADQRKLAELQNMGMFSYVTSHEFLSSPMGVIAQLLLLSLAALLIYRKMFRKPL